MIEDRGMFNEYDIVYNKDNPKRKYRLMLFTSCEVFLICLTKQDIRKWVSLDKLKSSYEIDM
jgi:hypothetical protein